MKTNPNSWEYIYSKNSNYRNNYPFDEVVTFIYQNKLFKKKSTILELGCGTGNNICFFSEIGLDTYGIDVSKTAIEYCKKKLKEKKLFANIRNIKIEKYKFKKNFFDFVVDRGSLTCLKYNSLKTTVNKINLSLKKGGIFFFTPHSDDSTRYEPKMSNNRFYIPKYLPHGKRDTRNIGFSFLSKKDIYELFNEKQWIIKNIYLKKNLDLKSNFCHSYFQVEAIKK